MVHRDRRWIKLFDLKEEEWALLEPLKPKSFRSARADYRTMMNTVFYVLRTGMPWRVFAGTLRALHGGLQSLQPLSLARYLEENLRQAGFELAR